MTDRTAEFARQIRQELAEVRRRVVKIEDLVRRLEQSDDASPRRNPSNADPADNPKTILVVDDDDNVRQFLCELCRMSGHRVVEADRGRDALNRIDERLPDLMFLDINMKGGTGLELVRILRRRNLYIPTIVISGAVSVDVTDQLLRLGVDGIVAKPFEARRILDEIRTALSGEDGPDDSGAPEVASSAS